MWSLALLSIILIICNYSFDCRTTCVQDEIMRKCSTVRDPVCAYFASLDCENGICQMEATNSCTACAERTVMFYENGRCTANKVFCDPRARPEFCTMEYAPVCAYYEDAETGELLKRTAGNGCSACGDFAVKYYIRGEC